MSVEERRKVLQMLADGKIGAEEAALLLRALDDKTDAQEDFAFEDGSNEKSDIPELEKIRGWARRVSICILTSGIIVSAVTAWVMSLIQKNYGVNFWFVVLCLPLLFGIALIVWSVSGWTRGLYLNARLKKADGLTNILIALPLPLGAIEWLFRVFGGWMKGLPSDAIASFISAAKKTKDPLIVYTDDEDEQIKVFVG